MEQNEDQRIGLANKLQSVYDGREVNLEQASMEVLQNCKLNKSKTMKTVRSHNLQTERSI